MQNDIACDYYKRHKEKVMAFCEEASIALNAIGPLTRNDTAWKAVWHFNNLLYTKYYKYIIFKVWIDWKSYIKRKLSTNGKELMNTGLVTNTSGISDRVYFGVSNEMLEDARASEMDDSVLSEDLVNVLTTSRRCKQQPNSKLFLRYKSK